MLKTQWIAFVFKRMRPPPPPPIYLNASTFERIIRDPASPPEEVKIHFFNEILQIDFPNNVSNFQNEHG